MVEKLTEIAKSIRFGIKLAGAMVKDYLDYRTNLSAISEAEMSPQNDCRQGYELQVLRGNNWVKFS